MSRSRLALLSLALVAALALLPVIASSAGVPARVNARKTSLGKVLVDGQARTLYLFKRDTGSKSRCKGACAQNWPPLTTSAKPKAGKGVHASLLGTSKRSDGTRQVTYNGHPLYAFVGDTKPGDTTGQGLNAFGGRWYVVSPTGKAITKAPAGAPAPYSY